MEDRRFPARAIRRRSSGATASSSPAASEKDGKTDALCLERTDGKVLWERKVVTAKLEHKHGLNSFASSTPATDGKYVWVSFLEYPKMVVICYDYDGKEVWRKSPGKLLSVHGFCTSPILHKDLVILNGDQDARRSPTSWPWTRTPARRSWRVDRPNKTRSYCTPILIESKGKPGVTQLVLSGSKCVTSYNADTGKLLWIINGPTEQYVASLVYLDNMLFPDDGLPGVSLDGHRSRRRRRHHQDAGVRMASTGSCRRRRRLTCLRRSRMTDISSSCRTSVI